MLSIKNLNVYYGAIHAVKDLDMEVGDGEIVTLIGSNGAGKSTTLHTISGLIKPRTGSIQYKGTEIVGIPAHKLVGQGLVQVPEGRHVFAEMTVMENLDMGAYLRKDKDEVARDKEKVFLDAFRRRTADAGHGPGAHEPTPAAAPGRTVHGAGSAVGAGNLLHHQGNQ